MAEEKNKQRNVRELLTEAKNVSDLIIDLAYASILYKDDELALKVRGLENRMDELMYEIRTRIALAVRNREEAESITGILQVASAAEEISNAAGDLANLVLRKQKIHPVVEEAIKDANEKVCKIEIGEEAQITGQKLKDLELPSKFSIWILAIKRDEKLHLSPQREDKIEAGDVILARGPIDGITKFSYIADAPEQNWEVKSPYKRLRKYLSQMRDTGCSLVDMAFSSVLFNSKSVAEEVRDLEQKFDEYNYEVWKEVLNAAKKEENVMDLNSALQFVKSLETISDAADAIADVILRGTKLHPVFTKALEEAGEQIDRVTIGQESSIADHTLKELDLWKRTGVYILAIKKNNRHILSPEKKTRLAVGDSIIIRGSKKGVDKLKKVANGKKRWKHLEKSND